MVAEALFSSAKTGGKDDWGTPECVLERVRKVGPIDLDPCPLKDELCWTGAEAYCTGDGLAISWAGYGLVYVNPPYSQNKAWVRKCAEEAKEGAEIILLVPARTDTQWFQPIWDTADAICFWRGRIVFKGAEHGAPFPSAAVYFAGRGYRSHEFKEVFRDAGKVVIL